MFKQHLSLAKERMGSSKLTVKEIVKQVVKDGWLVVKYESRYRHAPTPHSYGFVGVGINSYRVLSSNTGSCFDKTDYLYIDPDK